MRKFYLLFATLFAFSVVANAGVRNLYKQDFESVTTPAEAGWTSPNHPAALSIQSDEFGSFLCFDHSAANQNSRNAYTIWGKDIYTDALVDGTYHLQFDWSYQVNASNQYQTEIMVFTDDKPAANNSVLYTNENAHYIFALSQLDADMNFAINGDNTNIFVPELGGWYIISLDVDVNTRTVEWTIMDITGTPVATGIRTLPEGTEPYAQGINYQSGRYTSKSYFDNIMVQVVTDYDVANPPTVALVGINGVERTYNISFQDGETLHLKGTEGSEIEASYNSCGGTYVYTTTTSGTIQAWTTSGEATSEVISTEVECVPISLPAATASIVAVEAGYAKTYALTVSNADVPTQPQIFIEYSFVPEGGGAAITADEQISGVKVALPSKGTLTVTTKAVGFTPTTMTVVNNREFAVDKDIDFQHFTGAELIAKGFEQMEELNSATTSGENNWTARLRMNFQIATGEVDDDGNPTYTTYPVYGPTETGDPATPTGYEAIQRYRFLQSKLNEETAHSLFAPVYTWYGSTGVSPKAFFDADGNPLVDDSGNPGGTTNLQIKEGIGMVFSGQVNDAENYNPNNLSYSPILINYVTLGVDGLTDNDFIVVSKIDNYGGGSIHPQFPAGTDPEAAKAEYKAMNLGGVIEVYKGTETFQLYRVDTALSRVQTFKEKETEGIEEINTGLIVSDHNAPIYNISGVQVNPNSLRPGVYIKQGKKFIVR